MPEQWRHQVHYRISRHRPRVLAGRQEIQHLGAALGRQGQG